MKTNTGGFVVFKTKHELKCQFSGNTSPLLRFFDKLFDVIFDNPFFDVVKILRFCISHDAAFQFQPKMS